MFKRQINVELLKLPKKTAENAPESGLSPEDYVNVTEDIVRGVAKGLAFTVASYMACDTARKILVNRLSK